MDRWSIIDALTFCQRLVQLHIVEDHLAALPDEHLVHARPIPPWLGNCNLRKSFGATLSGIAVDADAPARQPKHCTGCRSSNSSSIAAATALPDCRLIRARTPECRLTSEMAGRSGGARLEHLCTNSQLVEILGPDIHHLATLFHELSLIVGHAQRPALAVRQLGLDYVRMDV